MSSRRVPARTLRRRFTLGSGPLKRTSDRVEFLSRVALVLALLLAVPAGLLVGAVGYTGAHATAQHEAATRHEVRAVLLADAAPAHAASVDTAGARVPTLATWPGPDGEGHTGNVRAPAGATAGTPVDIWTDDQGRVTDPPLTKYEALGQGVVLGVLVVLAVVIVGVSGHLVVLWILERRRFRRWEAGWATVEPLWVSRFR